jgi:hypothetical protein
MAITYSGGFITTTGSFDSGAATGGSTTTLADTSKSWTANSLVGKAVWIVSGTGAGQSRFISSNTANTLTVGIPFNVAPDATSSYRIAYTFEDFVAAVPAYAGYTGAADQKSYSIAASLYFGANAAVADKNANITFTVANAYMDGEATALFQLGELTAQGRGVNGCGVMVKHSDTSYVQSRLKGTTRLYASYIHVVRTIPLSVNSQWRIRNWDLPSGMPVDFDARDTVFNNVDVFLKGTERFERNTQSIAPLVIYAQSGGAIKDNTNISSALGVIGVRHIFDPVFDGAFEPGTFDRPLWSNARIETDSNVFIWNPVSLQFSEWSSIVRWYEPEAQFADIFHIGYSTKIKITDDSNSPLGGVRIAAFDKNGNPAWVASVDGQGLPIRTQAIITDGNGEYQHPSIGEGESGLIVRRVLTWGGSTVADKYDTDVEDLAPFSLRLVKYGYQEQNPSNISPEKRDGLERSMLPDIYIGESDAGVVEAYGSRMELTYSGGVAVYNLSGNAAHQEMYDYTMWHRADGNNLDRSAPITALAPGTFDMGTSIINLNGFALADATIKAQFDDPSQIVLGDGGFYEDANGAIWESGGSIFYASRAYFEVRDTDTAEAIEGCAIGFGDVATQTRLLYNADRQLDTLVTDADGKADGYLVYRIDGTTFSDTKQAVGEYDHVFATIPRALAGLPIGSAASPEVIRLAPDAQVTKTKAQAAAIEGVSWDTATDTVTTDESLPDTFDSLKYQLTADADISPGVSGCMAFCLFGLPIDKSGTRYTARTAATVYEGIDATTGTFAGGVVVLDAPGVVLGAWDGNTFRFDTAGTYDMRTASIAGTATLVNVSGGAVTVLLAPDVSFVNSGPNMTVEASVPCPIAAADLADGTRVQLYNVTQGTEIENVVVSGGAGYSYAGTLGAGQEFENGDQVRLRATRLGFLEYASQAAASANGIGFLGAPAADPVYAAYGLDGSTIATFAADYVNDEVDIVVSANFSGAEFWAWWSYNRTTEQGIREFFGAVQARDTGNIEIDTDTVNLVFDNLTSDHIWQTDAIRIYRSDGTRPVKNPTTGGGGVDVHWLGNVYVSQIVLSGENVITGDIADVPTASEIVAAIDAATVGVDVRLVNGFEVTGTGTEDDYWRPE